MDVFFSVFITDFKQALAKSEKDFYVLIFNLTSSSVVVRTDGLKQLKKNPSCKYRYAAVHTLPQNR